MTGAATGERTGGTTSWDGAPLVSGRHRRSWSWILLPLALAVAVSLLLSTDRRPDADRALVPVTPPGGFDVIVRVADVTPMDDEGVFGRRPVVADDRTVDTAARDIARAIRDYLDAVFVTADTRFSDAPVVSLLGPRARRAVGDADLRGLGVVDADVRAVSPQPVRASAHLVTDGGTVVFAAVRYDASAELVMVDGGSGTLHQRARMVFVHGDEGWRAEVAEAELDVPAVQVDR